MSSFRSLWWLSVPVVLILGLLCLYTVLCVQRLLGFVAPKYVNVWRIAAIPAGILLLFLAVRFQTAASIGLIYWLLFCGITALVGVIVRLVCAAAGKPDPLAADSFGARLFASGIPAFVFAVLLTVYGVWNMNRFRVTEHTVTSDKLSSGYRVVFISDTHYGTIQDKKVLREAAARISAEKPDLVILGGDIVDDGTSREDMYEAFAVLGGIDTKYGVYYIHGNHDRQQYSARKKYKENELGNAIAAAGITELNDEGAVIAGDLYLFGREDGGRSAFSAETLAAKISAESGERFVLLADHQPSRFGDNAAAGADLQLSGHTHAFQIWPGGMLLKHFMLWYGTYREGSAELFVSSGFAGWGYPVRTEKHCEYVSVTLAPAK